MKVLLVVRLSDDLYQINDCLIVASAFSEAVTLYEGVMSCN